jgi:SAM-dependent methyltransferase
MAVYSSHANVTATASLTTRLAINQKYGAFDFHEWVLSHLLFQPGMDVLDVGCGTGVHALQALRTMDGVGSVSAIDLSAESVETLKREARTYRNLDAVVADMKDLGSVIREKFRVKTYNLAYSVYALWYAHDHSGVLDAMRKALRPGSRLVVCTPNAPNGLREFIKRLGQPRPELDQVTTFGPNVLEPYFRAYFDDVTIHMRRNVMRISEEDDVLQFYRAAGYYDPELEPRVKKQVAMEIKMNGFFPFEKNNYLIQGVVPRG